MGSSADEQRQRELADQHRDEVVPGSGVAIEPRELPTVRAEPDAPSTICTWEDLQSSGLLWLINRTVFHPRGHALGLVYRGGLAVGWVLLGDGQAPWAYDSSEDAEFAAAKATLSGAP